MKEKELIWSLEFIYQLIICNSGQRALPTGRQVGRKSFKLITLKLYNSMALLLYSFMARIQGSGVRGKGLELITLQLYGFTAL